MSEMEFESYATNIENTCDKSPDLAQRIEEALKILKRAEFNLSYAGSDYGEIKLARLQFDFARHELLALIKEANNKGIKWPKDSILREVTLNDLMNFDSTHFDYGR